MKSIQHVLWRGALALSLVAVGLGSGIGLPAADANAARKACTARPAPQWPAQPETARSLVMERGQPAESPG